MTKYVVAVSGGVDSVALLHMLHKLDQHDLVVAHMDHGIRQDSPEDERFVRALADRYGATYHAHRVELGPNASEDRARSERYDFLRRVSSMHDNAPIVTAHHADDVVETVAINLHRGTGWRGLATHDSGVVRPLLGYTKSQLYEYAKQHGLEWREDSTNRDTKYLRNRIRQHVASMPSEEKRRIIELREAQTQLKGAIAAEVKKLMGDGPSYSRYFLTHIPSSAAIECLRFITEGRVTRPQLERALLAVKTAQPGSTHQIGAGVLLQFTTRNFFVSLIK